MFFKVRQHAYVKFVHSWSGFLTQILIFGILVNILVTKILKMLATRLIFCTMSLFDENIEPVDFHWNRLIDVDARAF